eukprot:30970-Pelagococcus_subviridis.AAC.6
MRRVVRRAAALDAARDALVPLRGGVALRAARFRFRFRFRVRRFVVDPSRCLLRVFFASFASAVAAVAVALPLLPRARRLRRLRVRLHLRAALRLRPLPRLEPLAQALARGDVARAVALSGPPPFAPARAPALSAPSAVLEPVALHRDPFAQVARGLGHVPIFRPGRGHRRPRDAAAARATE